MTWGYVALPLRESATPVRAFGDPGVEPALKHGHPVPRSRRTATVDSTSPIRLEDSAEREEAGVEVAYDVLEVEL